MNNTDETWETHIDSIHKQKAILFLGHDITLNYKNSQKEADFFRQLYQKNKEEIISFHEQDGFLVFKDSDARSSNLHKLQKFYAEDFTNPLLEKLAEIPFHAILTTTPDLTMNTIFEKNKFLFSKGYHRAKVKKEIAEMPSKEKPLLYNLLGSAEDDESLITSHYDLFNFVESIYASQTLPTMLSNLLNKENTRHIIFLGFDFGKWYFQLLLHLLKIKGAANKSFANTIAEVDVNVAAFFNTQFKIHFINHNLDSFVNTLHEKFAKEFPLRQPVADAHKQNRKYLKNNIVKLLSKAFNPTDFETFCLCNFETVHEEFTPEQGQSKRINMLLDYVERHTAYETLLADAEEENPVQFKNFAPYFE
jgi:SIR2-like domain